jgi:hypothetical protein
MLPSHTQPEKVVQVLLDQLQIHLPSQPPPRIKGSQNTALSSPMQPTLW